jgi:hypothetical protein
VPTRNVVRGALIEVALGVELARLVVSRRFARLRASVSSSIARGSAPRFRGSTGAIFEPHARERCRNGWSTLRPDRSGEHSNLVRLLPCPSQCSIDAAQCGLLSLRYRNSDGRTVTVVVDLVVAESERYDRQSRIAIASSSRCSDAAARARLRSPLACSRTCANGGTVAGGLPRLPAQLTSCPPKLLISRDSSSSASSLERSRLRSSTLHC